MRDQELSDLLRRAAAGVDRGDASGTPDLAQRAWAAGRARHRRRRQGALAVGALASVTMLGVGAVGLGGGPADPADPAAQEPPAAGGATDPPRTITSAVAEAQAHRSWRTVYASCLENRGYDVHATEPAEGGPGSLSVSGHGEIRGEYTRDREQCRRELAVDSGLPGIGEEVTDEDLAAVELLWSRYEETRACLSAADLPVPPDMRAQDFLDGYAGAGVVPWHPYLAAAQQGEYRTAMTTCPVPPG